MKEETRNKLQEVLETAVANNELAGGSLLVRKDGEELCYVEAGKADREKDIPIRRDQIFRLYSMSKPVTGVAAMKLFDEGVLDLAEPVSTFLPTYKNQVVDENGKLVPVENEMTVKNLLDMASGLIYGGEPGLAGEKVREVLERQKERMGTDDPMGTVELAMELGKCPLLFQPGSSWRYGTSADVLGAVIEVATGMRFGDYLEQNIFAPLGMKDTGFYVPAEKQDRLVTGYRRTAEGQLVPCTDAEANYVGAATRPAYESGGGGLLSTADDFARFGQMLLNGGELDGVRILHPETVRFMTAGALNEKQEAAFARNFPNMPGFTYGNQVRVMKYPGRANTLSNAGEYGWDGWMGCYFENHPNEKMTVIFMMQRTDAGFTPVIRRLRNILLRDL